MLKATDFQILRGVKACGRTKIPLERKPLRVCTLLDEAEFSKDQALIHHLTVFFEDKMHDWDWRDGDFRYYTRVKESADVLVIFAEEEVKPVARFDTKTGAPLNVTPEPDANQFRKDDVWTNSAGTRHRVVKVERRVAHLVNEKSGRTANRAWDDLGWSSGRPWVRVHSGHMGPVSQAAAEVASA